MSENLAPLSPEEEAQLASLLKRAQWPLKNNVFKAYLQAGVSVPVELGVFDAEGKILTFWRKDSDREYEGDHIPGTVMQDPDSIQSAEHRLVTSEVVGGDVTPLVDLGYIEIPKGNGGEENPTRHEVSLLRGCWLKGSYKGKNGEFHSPDALPDSLLPHHRKLVREIVARLHRHR